MRVADLGYSVKILLAGFYEILRESAAAVVTGRACKR